jgi:hypothetical protein
LAVAIARNPLLSPIIWYHHRVIRRFMGRLVVGLA